MAGIRGGGGVQTNVSLAKKSEVNDSVNSVTSIRLHKRWGVDTLQYSHPLTRPVTHLALSCNALYTWLTYISNYHNNRTLIIGEKSIKILFASKYFLYHHFDDSSTQVSFFKNSWLIFCLYLLEKNLFIFIKIVQPIKLIKFSQMSFSTFSCYCCQSCMTFILTRFPTLCIRQEFYESSSISLQTLPFRPIFL